jgi:protoheme IX farnesyltransferase
MALVVTADSHIETPSLGPAPPKPLARARTWSTLGQLAAASAAGYALLLVGEAAVRATPLTQSAETANLAFAACALILTLSVCVAAWLDKRHDAGLLLAATLAPILVAVRGLTTALLTLLQVLTLAEVLNLALGLLVLASLVWTATAWALAPARPVRGVSPQAELFQRVSEITALVLFAVGLSGASVRATGASWACRGMFPDCDGFGVLAFGRDPLADVQLYHRLLSYAVLGLVVWLAIEAFRTQRAVAWLPTTVVVLLLTTILDAAVGALSVSIANPPLAEVAHTAASAATWSTAVALVVVAHRAPLVPAPNTLKVALAYVQLTKPRVMSLLLATTAAAMVIAARGLPDLGTLLATLLGGALMSGGAGAINHYVDRDIDPLMGRTAWRPIPSGVISPASALRFGIGLAVIASGVFVLFVNVLACVLALLGLLGYVFIYTLWLKRSTPSNIVIGGAAGAIPPLVGWAAVTNEISSLTAWYLFAIIFFWTPPHFWALSLLIRQHYERAGVPMLPVVRGEDETRRQIVLYALLLIVLTLVLSPFGMMGGVYFVAALVLGALFIRYAVQLWRQATRQAARQLYLYSMLYLFALFAAMAVDRVVSSL